MIMPRLGFGGSVQYLLSAEFKIKSFLQVALRLSQEAAWEATCTVPAENISWVHPDGYRVMSPPQNGATHPVFQMGREV